MEVELDNYTVVVYTPEMIAIEKLRAICQQMPEYPLRSHPAPRARDFYDVYSTVTSADINLGTKEHLELVRSIFAAKSVDLGLLNKIENYQEFHGQDWRSVEDTVFGDLNTFDFYFDFVVKQVQLLKSLWEE